MTHPASNFLDAQTRWLIEALSLTAPDDALIHLANGWREFPQTSAVFLVHQSRGESRGVFLEADQSPRWFSKIPLGEVPDELARENRNSPAIISFNTETNSLGQVWLWGSEEIDSSKHAWLTEASLRVLESLKQTEDRLRAEKLEAMGEFAAGAGHEINNPVATISGRVQRLLQHETDPERRRLLKTIGGQALRIRDMIGDAMLFARPPEPEPKPLELQTVLPNLIEPLQFLIEDRQAKFSCEVPGSVPIFADRGQLGVVITELLRNSLDWLSEGGEIQVQAKSIESSIGLWANLVIEDNGESFSEDQAEHVFDPFFSGRQAGRGLGFGLPKCWRIVSNHHARIEILSRPEQGTRITVNWPAYDFRSTT